MKLDAQLSAWLDAVSDAFSSGALIKISLRKPSQAAGDLKSVDIKPVIIKRARKLSFTFHHKTRDIVKNYDVVESRDLLAQLVQEMFTAGRLYQVESDIGLTRNSYDFKSVKSKPTLKPVDQTHNRAKNHIISGSGKPYLQALGLTDGQGVVFKTAQDKFRQINKYIEIVDGLIKDLPLRNLRICDMGSGKGYLTFALYDHLTARLNRDCEVVGVEYRTDLVKLCNDIAETSEFSGLNFVEGTIADYDCAGSDMVIALHACDTATDDAIAKAIQAQAQIIVVAPCCHKQIRREMKASGAMGDLDFLLRFGTYQERFCDMITDGLRVQLMELSGYECNLFEFISDAHTPKNVMIVGKRLSVPRSTQALEKITADISGAKQRFGIGMHYLERLLTAQN